MSQDVYVVIEHLRGEVAEISYVMLAAARALVPGKGGRLVALLLGHDAQALSEELAADRVFYFDHPSLTDFNPEAYKRTLLSLVREEKPRAVFLGSTSIGSDLAGALSARLDLPLVSSCRSVSPEGVITCQMCGGKMLVETRLPETTALLTMIPGGYRPEEGRSAQPPEVFRMAPPPLDDLRLVPRRFIEPEVGEVDIARQEVLVAIGRGIQRQDNVQLGEELAAALGVAVCASRPVVDQGWLPASRLVGRSGKRVKAKLYLALGISGAPEHVEGMGDSELIIAVNTDPTAPIFQVATYGATVDLFELVPELTEQIRARKAAAEPG